MFNLRDRLIKLLIKDDVDYRKHLIDWIADYDIVVIINSVMYDAALESNRSLRPGKCVFSNNNIVNFDKVMEDEVEQRLKLRKQGVKKSGNGFVLIP